MLAMVMGLAAAIFASWVFVVVAKQTPTFELERHSSAAAIPVALIFRLLVGPGLIVIGLCTGRIDVSRPGALTAALAATAAWSYATGSLLLAAGA